MGGDCRGVALLRLKTAFYNRMAINIITDIFIAVYTVLFCDVGYEAQQRYASTVIFQNSTVNYNFREIREICAL